MVHQVNQNHFNATKIIDRVLPAAQQEEGDVTKISLSHRFVCLKLDLDDLKKLQTRETHSKASQH